jgi:hypothetical protein
MRYPSDHRHPFRGKRNSCRFWTAILLGRCANSFRTLKAKALAAAAYYPTATIGANHFSLYRATDADGWRRSTIGLALRQIRLAPRPIVERQTAKRATELAFGQISVTPL